MTHFSFLLLPPLPSFGSEDEIRRTFDLIKSCGYEGVELNLTPATFDYLSRLEGWLADCGLAMPSWCTGEAYGDGLCFVSPDAAIRKRAVERLVGSLGFDDVEITVRGFEEGARRRPTDAKP